MSYSHRLRLSTICGPFSLSQRERAGLSAIAFPSSVAFAKEEATAEVRESLSDEDILRFMERDSLPDGTGLPVPWKCHLISSLLLI